MALIQVDQLTIYPVKSMRGISLQQMSLAEKGPVADRRWMVIDANGKQRTQRQIAAMCLINTHLQDGILTLTAADRNPCVVDIKGLTSASAASTEVQVWRDTVAALDCGDQVADWISDTLGLSSRLVYMPDQTQRLVDQDYAKHQETVGFADAFPILLASQASLDDFNTKLGKPVAMNRFRPNITISGASAYAEDQWRTIRIAGVTFSIASACSRCIMPSIDPETGEKQMEVIDALNQHRRRDGATYFGQNVLYQQRGTISVGDTVEILE